MIVVLENNAKQKETRCECCGSLLSYMDGDVIEMDPRTPTSSTIKEQVLACPACGAYTRIRSYTYTIKE